MPIDPDAPGFLQLRKGPTPFRSNVRPRYALAIEALLQDDLPDGCIATCVSAESARPFLELHVIRTIVKIKPWFQLSQTVPLTLLLVNFRGCGCVRMTSAGSRQPPGGREYPYRNQWDA